MNSPGSVEGGEEIVTNTAQGRNCGAGCKWPQLLRNFFDQEVILGNCTVLRLAIQFDSK
jgi:hypothetical protein